MESNNSKQNFSEKQGLVIWITGLSGSGKSTLAVDLVRYLKTHQENVLMLDGDDLREILGTEKDEPTNYTHPKRLEVAMRYSRLCRMISAQGFNVVIATMSLFNEVHKWNRTYITNYFEVYLKVPINELRRRDPKQIYDRYDKGKITNVAGLDLPIDEPYAADLILEFEKNRSIESLVTEIANKIDTTQKQDNQKITI